MHQRLEVKYRREDSLPQPCIEPAGSSQMHSEKKKKMAGIKLRQRILPELEILNLYRIWHTVALEKGKYEPFSVKRMLHVSSKCIDQQLCD